MDNSIKTLIETYNTSSLIHEFTSHIIGVLPIIFPIGGGIAVTFLAIRVVRRILHV